MMSSSLDAATLKNSKALAARRIEAEWRGEGTLKKKTPRSAA